MQLEMLTFNDDKFYRPLEPILDEVNTLCVKMNEDKKYEYRDIAIKVVREVIDLLHNGDDVFKKIYSKLEFVGSYYDGLRVKEATEFDLNVIVKLPLQYKMIKVENTNAAAGYVKVNIADAKNYVKYVDPCKKVIDKWCDGAGYLKQNAVRSWLEGVIAKHFGSERIINTGHHSYRVRWRKSGPAFTLMIHVDMITQIDVDLVLTLEFPKDMQPPSSIRWVEKLAAPWVVVPKPLESEWNKELLWRISFPLSEKRLILALQKLKFINRFLKALRDAQNMNIASYYIKTVFLWEGHKIFYNEMDRNLWEKNKGVLFVYGLSKMQAYLENRRLPYYWHKQLNLFQYLGEGNAANMANRLNNIIKTIKKYLIENKITELKQFIFSLYGIDGPYNLEQGLKFVNTALAALSQDSNNGNIEENQSSCSIF